MRAYNFSPGPAALPDAVIEQAQRQLGEYSDWRASVMEVSHRSSGFMEIYRQCERQLRALMNISSDYAVLFLAGGATGQTAAVPLNLTAATDTAAYVISGYWSQRAAGEARHFCKVNIAGDSAADNYITIPQQLDITPNAAYVHIAENETVHGTEYRRLPTAAAPIVADLSSNIATRVIDVNDYGLIYAGAQKNLGIAGITIVIVRRALIKPRADTPSVWNYEKQLAADSMYNTPPTFQIYMLGLVLDWLGQQGGIAALEKINQAKAAALYDCIDNSGFYRAAVSDAACRSRVNVPFFLADDNLTADFLAQAEQRGLLGLKGHKVLGGIRASLYNSMPPAGVAALVEYMQEFEKTKG